MTYQSDLLTTLTSRGYVHQMTDAAALDALAGKQVVPGYIGFDPTAPSLHVGSLVQIMLLRRLQQTGHKPIVLMGGGTGKIGDPSFKDEARKLLGEEGIKANVASIKRIFERFLTFGDGPTDAVMLDNAEWLDQLEYIPFLRGVGQHFSVNRMLSFDSVKLRLDRELAALQVAPVHVRDLELAARRGGEPRRDARHLPVVEVEARHRIARLGMRGLLLDAHRAAALVELHHAVALRILHRVREYRRARLVR